MPCSSSLPRSIVFCKSRDSPDMFLSFSIALKPSTATLLNSQRFGSYFNFASHDSVLHLIGPFFSKNHSNVWGLLTMFYLLELLLKSAVSSKR